MTIEYKKDRGVTLTVLADGKFHQNVDEKTENAVRREYETSDGKKGVKFELVADAVSGVISNIDIYEGDYGKQLQVNIGEGKELVTMFLSANSAFGEDFMKKLPNIKEGEHLRFAPYSFDDEAGKKRKGLTIYRSPDDKLADFYHKKEGDKVLAINGYPEIPTEAKDWDSEDWKLFFGTARKYLLEQVKKHTLYGKKKSDFDGLPVAYPTEDINPSKIPF